MAELPRMQSYASIPGVAYCLWSSASLFVPAQKNISEQDSRHAKGQNDKKIMDDIYYKP
jgi:hypothetical protein